MTTPFHHVNLRVAEAIVKQPKRYGSGGNYTVNNEILSKIGKIRTLEDQLLALQYERQLLIEQSNHLTQELQRLREENAQLEERMVKVEGDLQLHRIKKEELYNCDMNLKSLYEEIDELTLVSQKKEDQCEQLIREKQKILQENEELQIKKEILICCRSFVQVKVEDYFRSFNGHLQKQFSPVSNLQIRVDFLINSLERLKDEEKKIKKENQKQLGVQTEIALKMVYEQELLRQRLKDIQKNEEIARICETQQNLDRIVEDMLLKEDQLVIEINKLRGYFQEEENKLRDACQQMQDEWCQQSDLLQQRERQIIVQSKKVICQIEEMSRELQYKIEKQKKISIEYELICKMKLNLASMQRLREAEERNNYLKLKIGELKDIRSILKEEKEISECQIEQQQ